MSRLKEAINLLGTGSEQLHLAVCHALSSGPALKRGWVRPSDQPHVTQRRHYPQGTRHIHPEACWGEVKGDDGHHTCVITSAAGLAYQHIHF